MQISMFDGTRAFKIDKPIRLIELFAGYGSQALALKYLGVPFEHWRISEWAVKSIQAYKDMHATDDTKDYSENLTVEQVRTWLNGKISTDYNAPLSQEQISRLPEKQVRRIYNNMQATHNLGSITQITAKDCSVVDTDKYCYIMTYSFPCFTADSLVLTDKGYKHIVDVQVGDIVLTHDNTYQEVLKTFDNGIKPLVKINAMAVDEIKCTTNHRFYVRTMRRVGHLGKRVFDEPIWKQASELTKKDYLGVAINQNSIVHEWNGVDYHWQDGRADRHKNTINGLLHCYDFWWIIGRYIGDGWQTKNGIIICCPKHNTEEIEKRLGKIVNYTKTEDRSTYRYVISSKEWLAFVCQFGKGAEHKHLTDTILDLPRALLKGFLDGYMSADGCYSCNLYKATSISRELVYGLAQCVAKVYRVPYRIYHTKRPPKYIIEGREVNQNDTWQLVWKTQIGKQDKAFFQDNHVWFPIKEITEIEPQNVYDIEVKNNHSFTVQNTIVHNCQDLSAAGNGAGMKKDSGTRSGLLWEVERILKQMTELPQVLLMENVPQVVGSAGIKDFALWIQRLEEFGYKNYWKCLNAKDYGVPQNRNRCFMVSILGDYFYDFPKKIPLKLRLKDMLEKEVDEKYYLSSVGQNYFSKKIDTFEDKRSEYVSPYIVSNNHGTFKGEIKDCTIHPTITTNTSPAWKQVLLEENKAELIQVAQLTDKKYNEMTGRVYSDKGLCPTIRTMQGGGLEPKVAEPIAYDEQNQYLRQDGCVGTLTTDGSSPKHNNRVLDSDYRIRKLTERECFRLMGVKSEDFEKVAENQSISSCYHLAGDSIVTTCLMAIFGEMLDTDYEEKIKELSEALKNENLQ